MDMRDRIVELIRSKGPVLPVQISKEIGSNILMASAHLAELTASGKAMISSLKVGGSPLYYLSGQESLLLKFAANLNDKEKRALELLREKKVLMDSEQAPIVRVSLREIKDFAVQLNVNYDGSTKIFWKWHLLSNEEAEPLIKAKLGIADKVSGEEPNKNAGEPEAKAEAASQKAAAPKPAGEPKPVQKERKPRPGKEKPDDFLNEVMKFFEKNGVKVISSETVKRNSEIDFVVELPTVVGSLQYYCKAKNKKRVSDSDLSNAYVKGQLKRLPVIVLSPGELSSKAAGMIGKELNIAFKKI